MSAKSEKYKSVTAKKRHEKNEGAKERKMEYGTAKKKKKINPLDKAIMEGKKLPSKNKKPGRFLDK